MTNIGCNKVNAVTQWHKSALHNVGLRSLAELSPWSAAKRSPHLRIDTGLTLADVMASDIGPT